MSDEVHTRAVGLRLAVVATAAAQARDLDQALDFGHRVLQILARVSSARAEGYLRAVTAALAPWAADARVREFTECLDQRLTGAVAKGVI